MVEALKLYIDGRWVSSAGDEVVDVVDPTTTEVIGHAPAGTAEDVEAAVAAAKAAFGTWSTTSVADRANVLRTIGDLIEKNAEELVALAARDVGTPVSFGKGLHGAVPTMTFRNMAENVERFPFESRDGNLMLVREPVGVVGAITPWNYPLHQIAAKVAPALGAGCTVVVKPSEVAPLAAWRFAELMATVGLPNGVFNMISGLGPVVGECLAKHPDVDMVSFTGSVRAGTRVAELAAAGVKRVTLEQGGKSPNIVLDDVENLQQIVSSAVASAYGNSGQTCSALTRLIVPRTRLDEVEEIARAAADAMPLGDPADETTKLGPVVSAAQRDRVVGYIEHGIDEGARLVTGGPDATDTPPVGYYVRPTIFSDVDPDMVIAQEEIFGPVLVIIPFDDETDAVAIANNSNYGLSGGVWSADVSRAERVAKQLRTGQVKVNGGAFNPAAPFGGYKQSGIGRELGPLGLEEYLETKALTF